MDGYNSVELVFVIIQCRPLFLFVIGDVESDVRSLNTLLGSVTLVPLMERVNH